MCMFLHTSGYYSIMDWAWDDIFLWKDLRLGITTKSENSKMWCIHGNCVAKIIFAVGFLGQ